ncbi:MAG: 4Fe-4S dicluster domain-containing protein [Bacteroidales bacterium]|nr:4Fe-4S dicluster domain-containing protein [Bacteroidales bacterium]
MNELKQLVTYYFSGTGNARQVARWISEVAVKKKLSAYTLDISTIDRKNISKPSPGTLLCFCSPTHGFNYPPVMMKLIFRFPKANGSKVLLINTRAGMKVFGLFLPGLSGIALLLSAVVLMLKGYKIAGMRSVDLPSNWISLHPAVRPKAIESMFEKWKIITDDFAGNIVGGGKDYKALRTLPLDILLLPVALLYYVIGRFVFAKSFYASLDCNNCGLCIKECPVNAISLVDNRPFWSYRCESCMHCMNACPKSAIETAHGYVIGMLILLNTIAQTYLYVWLLDHHVMWFSASAKFGSLLRFVLETLIVFFSLVISYRILHFLRRFKAIDLLINYTSLTTYKFWGRYKPAKWIKN